MENTTFAVCNGKKENERRSKLRYPLEQQLRSLATEPGAYILAIFDCCRERLSEAMRGGADAPAQDVADLEDYCNYVFVFGCPPNSGVSASSTIAVDFFKQLRNVARPHDGSVVLPLDIMTWTPGDDGELAQKMKMHLELVHDEWEPTGPGPQLQMFGDDAQGDDERKNKRLELRNKMAELFVKAKNENIITELELDPVDDTMLRNLGVSNIQFKTIAGFANKTKPLEDYKNTLKLFRKDH